MPQSNQITSISASWQVPAALTHHTWQAAWASCHAAFSEAQNAENPESAESTPSFYVDWQSCHRVDSSAIAFILAAQRELSRQNDAGLTSKTRRIVHQNPPLQLRQLAALYELDDMLGLAA